MVLNGIRWTLQVPPQVRKPVCKESESLFPRLHGIGFQAQ
jgi:hypothetical protein